MGSKWGVVLGALLGVVAVVFLVLWFLRGEEIYRLQRNLEQETRQSSSETTRLRGELDRLSAALGDAGDKTTELEKEVQQARSSITRLEQDKTSLTFTADDTASRLAEQLKASKENQGKITQLEDQAKNLAAESGKIVNQLSQAQGELAQAKSELRQSQSELRQAQNELAQARDELSLTQATLEEVKPANGGSQPDPTNNLAEKLRAASLALRESNARVESLTQKFATLALTSSSELEAAKENAAELSRQLAEQSSKIEAAQKSAPGTPSASPRANGVAARAASNLAKAEQDLQSALVKNQELNSQLESVRQELRESASLGETLRRELAIAQGEHQAAQTQLARLQPDLTTASQQLGQAKAGREVAEKALAGLQRDFASVTLQLGQEKSGREATEKNLAGLQQELTSVTQQLDQAKSGREATEKTLAGLKQELASVTQQFGQAKAGREASEKTLASLQQELASVTQQFGQAKAGREATEKTLASLKQELASVTQVAAVAKDRQQATEKQLSQREGELTGVRGELSKAQASLADQDKILALNTNLTNEVKALREKQFAKSPPVRGVGKILQVGSDNRGLTLNLGATNRVREGIKFDIYRPSLEGNRFIGRTQVLQVTESTSLAVADLRLEPVMVCPETGYAVLEPGARFSPFATGKDGAPLPLRDADEVGIPIEAPCNGDILANPFFSPGERLAFVIEEGAFATPEEGIKLVEFFGGAPKAWDTQEKVDFVISARPGQTSRQWNGNPRVVSSDYLRSY
ncbi:MAG: hypothetical protein LBU79_06795, partial [Planctomycetota bacterium]|nr:hypothetical protein [Planctomycetota bacterium]